MKNKQNGKNIAQTVKALVEPVITELGCELWDVEFVKEGADFYLRITIDSDSGINIDDCERVHRAIDPILDEADPIESSYRLEVSSPGIERELRTQRHIEAFAGADDKLEVRFYAPHDGKKSVIARISAYDAAEDILTLALEDGTMEVKRADCAKIKVLFDFGDQ